MLHIDDWIKAALSPIPLPLSEEPMRLDVTNTSYMTWRKSREQTVYASGIPIQTTHHIILSLWAVKEDDWAGIAKQATQLLKKEKACSMARAGGENWDATIKRREVPIYVAIREVHHGSV